MKKKNSKKSTSTKKKKPFKSIMEALESPKSKPVMMDQKTARALKKCLQDLNWIPLTAPKKTKNEPIIYTYDKKIRRHFIKQGVPPERVVLLEEYKLPKKNTGLKDKSGRRGDK